MSSKATTRRFFRQFNDTTLDASGCSVSMLLAGRGTHRVRMRVELWSGVEEMSRFR